MHRKYFTDPVKPVKRFLSILLVEKHNDQIKHIATSVIMYTLQALHGRLNLVDSTNIYYWETLKMNENE